MRWIGISLTLAIFMLAGFAFDTLEAGAKNCEGFLFNNDTLDFKVYSCKVKSEFDYDDPPDTGVCMVFSERSFTVSNPILSDFEDYLDATGRGDFNMANFYPFMFLGGCSCKPTGQFLNPVADNSQQFMCSSDDDYGTMTAFHGKVIKPDGKDKVNGDIVVYYEGFELFRLQCFINNNACPQDLEEFIDP